MAKQAEKLFAVIGRGADADDARKLAREMREAIRKTLLDRETATLCQGTQTGQALGLAEGVFDDGEETARAVSVLLQKIREKGDRFDCGCLGMGKLFDVLSEYGEGELAYRLAMQEGYPSYRQWIDRGETSLCEGFQPDGVVCGSHNHHFFGDIAGWFFRRVAGIRILSHNCVEIRPQFLSALDFAEGWCELPDGHVFTRWERTKNGCTVSYRCPASISCTVIAPEGTGVRVIKN